MYLFDKAVYFTNYFWANLTKTITWLSDNMIDVNGKAKIIRNSVHHHVKTLFQRYLNANNTIYMPDFILHMTLTLPQLYASPIEILYYGV